MRYTFEKLSGCCFLIRVYSPAARWGLLDFMSVACSSPPLLSSSSSCSTATLDAQCSLSDLNHDHPRPVFPAGPQPRPSPPSVPCRTSTTTIHAQCSLPDLNREYPRQVFPAGPHVGRYGTKNVQKKVRKNVRQVCYILLANKLHFFCVYFVFSICFLLLFCFSPPARWGSLDFIRAVLLLLLLRLRLLLLLRLLLAVQIPVGTAGPQPRVADRSGHCRTSTASSRSQWALPDLNRELQIPVGTAGPQPRAPDRSGHCRTSTATSRSQWALPDLNRDFQIAVGTAGPQREEKMSDRMSEDMSEDMPEECQKECQKICQTECQKICQKECQKICQIECQKICQIECQIDLPVRKCQIKCHGGDHTK